jgi:excisionase family DNA binding protein
MRASEPACDRCCHCPKPGGEPETAMPPEARPTAGFAGPASDTAPNTGPLLLTIEQASQVLAIGRTAVYALIGSGQLGSVCIGRSRRIPLSALNNCVQQLITDAAPAPPHPDT